MLRWDWNEQIGIICWKDYEGVPYETNVYRGNAMIICIQEWTTENRLEDWRMRFFLVDKGHFKNCCKDKDWNFAEDMVFAEFWDLNSETWSFVKELHRRGIPVDIRSEAPKDWRKEENVLEG